MAGLALSLILTASTIGLPGLQQVYPSLAVALVLLVFAGLCLLWAPLGASILAWLARGAQPQTTHPAVVGATYSATLFFPWGYQVLQMQGTRVWRPAIWLAYFLLYASWLLGPTGSLLLGFILSTTMGGQSIYSPLSLMFLGPCGVMATAWSASLYLLLVAALNLGRTTRVAAPHMSTGWTIAGVYYAPFALSFASLVLFLIVGIIFAFGT